MDSELSESFDILTLGELPDPELEGSNFLYHFFCFSERSLASSSFSASTVSMGAAMSGLDIALGAGVGSMASSSGGAICSLASGIRMLFKRNRT